MHITLRQMRLLRAIAHHETITRAAQAVNLSQPAVSLQMKMLEQEVGEPLWEKVNKRLYMTAAGNIVLEAAQDVLQRIDRMEGELEATRGQVTGELDIAVVTSAKHFLPHFLGEFLRLHPLVKPRLTVTNRASVLEALAENRHDIYIMGQIPDRLQVEAFPILDNILEVVAAEDHPLRNEKHISLERLAEERFLVREAGSGTRFAVEKLFARHKLQITPFMELGSTGAIKNAVIAGLGIAVLSRHSLEYELKAKALCILDVEGFPLHRRWYACRPGGKRMSVAAKSFFDHLTHLEQKSELTRN